MDMQTCPTRSGKKRVQHALLTVIDVQITEARDGSACDGYLLGDGGRQVAPGAVPRHGNALWVHRVLVQHPLLEKVFHYTVHILEGNGKVVSGGKTVPGKSNQNTPIKAEIKGDQTNKPTHKQVIYEITLWSHKLTELNISK